MVKETPSFNITNADQLAEAKKCSNVYGGSPYVKEYLNKSVSESDTEYASRKEISSIKSIFEKGIDSFKDIIFRKDLEFTENMPENIVKYYEKVSGKENLTNLAKNTLRDILLENESYWLVWTPNIAVKNAKEEEERGVRPYVEKIGIDSIVDSMTFENEIGELIMVTVIGSYVYSKTKYEKEYKKEYRIYFDTGIVEIWREGAKGIVEYIEEITLGVEGMPIVKFSFDDDEVMPPFINEANLQLQQYNIESAKYSYNMKIPFLFVTSFGMLQNSRNIATDSTDDDDNPIKIVEFQSSKGIDFPVNPETGAKIGGIEFKEVSGDNDKVLKSTSEDLGKAIMEGFITITTDGSGNKTVEQSQNERVAGESTLSSTASKLEMFLNKVHVIFCAYASTPPKGEITVNKQFIKDELDELEYKMLIDLLGEEIIDKKEFILELQRYGKLKNVNVDELINRLTAVGKQ